MKPEVTEDRTPTCLASYPLLSPGEALAPAKPYLAVSLQSGDKGPLVEKQLQTLVSIIVAQLLEGGGPLFALVPGVLKAWRVHHHDGGHGEVMGGEGSGKRGVSPPDNMES